MNQMKNKISSFLAALGLLVVSACIKHPANSNPCENKEIYLDSYAKSLIFVGKSTSYWICQDSLGNVDSSWINGAIDGPIIPDCFENYVYNLYSSFADNDFNISGGVSPGS